MELDKTNEKEKEHMREAKDKEDQYGQPQGPKEMYGHFSCAARFFMKRMTWK